MNCIVLITSWISNLKFHSSLMEFYVNTSFSSHQFALYWITSLTLHHNETQLRFITLLISQGSTAPKWGPMVVLGQSTGQPSSADRVTIEQGLAITSTDIVCSLDAQRRRSIRESLEFFHIVSRATQLGAEMYRSDQSARFALWLARYRHDGEWKSLTSNY